MSNIIDTLHPKASPTDNLYPNIKSENIPSGAVTMDKLSSSVKSSITSATPKIFDTTANITALTSDEGVAVSTDDGYVYVWDENNSIYVNTGVQYMATTVADESVGVQQTNFMDYQDSNNTIIFSNDIPTITGVTITPDFSDGGISVSGTVASNTNIDIPLVKTVTLASGNVYMKCWISGVHTAYIGVRYNKGTNTQNNYLNNISSNETLDSATYNAGSQYIFDTLRISLSAGTYDFKIYPYVSNSDSDVFVMGGSVALQPSISVGAETVKTTNTNFSKTVSSSNLLRVKSIYADNGVDVTLNIDGSISIIANGLASNKNVDINLENGITLSNGSTYYIKNWFFGVHSAFMAIRYNFALISQNTYFSNISASNTSVVSSTYTMTENYYFNMLRITLSSGGYYNFTLYPYLGSDDVDTYIKGVSYDFKYNENKDYESTNIKRAIIDNQKKNDFRWADLDAVYCTMTFDDCNADIDQLENLAETLNIPLCFAAIPSKLGNTCSLGVKTVKEVLEDAVANGGEVLSHWQAPLISSSIEDFYKEVYIGAKKTLENNGFEINGIITAGGTDYLTQDFDLDTELARIYYLYADLTSYNNQSVKQYYNPRTFTDAGVATMKSYVDSIVANGKGWINFASHGFLNGVGVSMTSLSDFQELFEYMISKGVIFTTWKNLYDTFRSSELEERIKALE